MLWHVLLSALLIAAFLPARAQWTLQASNTTADLRGIHSIGNGVAWASGTNGTVLRTEDGGYVWQSCSVPPGAEHLDFRGIQAFDANAAIVMSSGKGELSRLYKTTDGCHSWKLLFTNPDKDGFWDALLVGGKTVFILGDPVNDAFVFEESHDLGATWRRNSLPASLPDEGAFAASNSSLLTDSANGVIMFGTGGPRGARLFFSHAPCTRPVEKDCWSPYAMPMFGAGAPMGIFSLAANRRESADRFVAVGGDYSKPDQAGTAAFTSDKQFAGWAVSQTPPHGYRSSVAYDQQTKTWITVGPNGTDISTDDGKNWRPLYPDPAQHDSADADKNWNAISLPFVVGPKGRIGRHNGGGFAR
jgi:hypothetical protein